MIYRIGFALPINIFIIAYIDKLSHAYYIINLSIFYQSGFEKIYGQGLSILDTGMKGHFGNLKKQGFDCLSMNMPLF